MHGNYLLLFVHNSAKAGNTTLYLLWYSLVHAWYVCGAQWTSFELSQAILGGAGRSFMLAKYNVTESEGETGKKAQTREKL